MNLELVERIANAVLYEGYVLYPYRPSSVKNRRRFNFGVLVPPAYSTAQSGTERSTMQTECLVVCASPQTRLDVSVRFLQVMAGSWQEAQERNWNLQDCHLADLLARPWQEQFHFPARQGSIDGLVTVTARLLGEGVFRVTVLVANVTQLEDAQQLSRDEVLPYSLAAAHTILAVRDGEFVSLLDPPENLRGAAAECQNLGTWPVLAGEQAKRDVILSSPIILYDYPEIAPESPGDLFDSTEIDEILTLRIMTLTEDEKREVRQGDERARRILERTETLPEEHLLKLHGVLRGLRPVKEHT